MKIWRCPKLSYHPTRTDEKGPREYTKRWEPGNTIWFDGTIDKSGQRGTEFGVELDAQDVLALQAALVRHYRSCINERDALEKIVNQLEQVLAKISRLVSSNRQLAPSANELLDAVEEIAFYFSDELDER